MAVLGDVAGWNLLHCPTQGVLSAGKTSLLTVATGRRRPRTFVPRRAWATALQEGVRLRAAAARADGAGRLRGHIVCDGLVRVFKAEGVEVVALQGLDLVVDRGELMALVGASGSGKSTLLTILSGLDVPTAGTRTMTLHQVAA